MTKSKKYLEVLKTFDDWVIVSKGNDIKTSSNLPMILPDLENLPFTRIASRLEDGLKTLLERLERL